MAAVDSVEGTSDSPTSGEPFVPEGVTDPDDRTQWTQQVQEAIQAGDGEILKKVTKAMYERFPDDPDVAMYCGTIWLQMKNWDMVRQLDVELPHEPEDGRVALTQAMRASQSQKLYLTYRYLKEAYRLAPQDKIVLLNYGSFLCRFGDCETGRVVIEELVELEPDNPYSHLARAKVALSFKDTETGWAALAEAERLMEEQEIDEPRVNEEIDRLMVSFLELDPSGDPADQP